ncbi:amidase signature domain-containing protein [Amanita rubescens]|nr:amidase signature domain-containing protein [Amanita rubescens]
MVSFQKVVDAKREQRRRALATAGAPCAIEYTHSSASQIVSHIQKGEWTASEVLEAYISRATLAQENTNCLTEVMFDWARKQAKTLDEEFAATGTLRGPLHGVPVSCTVDYSFVRSHENYI